MSNCLHDSEAKQENSSLTDNDVPARILESPYLCEVKMIKEILSINDNNAGEVVTSNNRSGSSLS